MRPLRPRKQTAILQQSSLSRAARLAARVAHAASAPIRHTHRRPRARKVVTAGSSEPTAHTDMEVDGNACESDVDTEQGETGSRSVDAEMDAPVEQLSDDPDSDVGQEPIIIDNDEPSRASVEMDCEPDIQPPAYDNGALVLQTTRPSAVACSQELYYAGMDEIWGCVTSDVPRNPMLPEIPLFLKEFVGTKQPQLEVAGGSEKNASEESRQVAVCVMLVANGVPEHHHMLLDILSRSCTPPVQQLFNCLHIECSSQPHLRVMWEKITSKEGYQMHNAKHHPFNGHPIKRNETSYISDLGVLLKGNAHGSIKYATGHGAEEVLIEMGLAHRFHDPYAEGESEHILMDTELFVLVLGLTEDLSMIMSTSEASTSSAPPGPLIHRGATVTGASRAVTGKGKERVNTEQAFGSANEALAHSFLLRNHADTIQLIENLDDLAGLHRCGDGPLHTMAALSVVETVLAAEGFDLERYARLLTKQVQQRPNFSLDLATVLRWASPGRQAESWRQSRSTLQSARTELTTGWSAQILMLRRLTTTLNPPIRVLDVVESIENVIQELQCVLLEPNQTLALDCTNLTDRQDAALAYTWKSFRRHHTALPALQDLVQLAELAVTSFSSTQINLLYHNTQALATELLDL